MKHDLTTTEAGRRKLKAAEEAFTAAALSTHQLAEAIHVSTVHAYRYVAILRGERPEISPRRLYIAEWPLSGTVRPRRVAAYRWMVTGKEKDARKPAALTARQRTKLRTERIRKDAQLRERVNTMRRIRRYTRLQQPAHMLSPLFFRPSP